MAKRNVFNISDDHLQKEAFVGKLMKFIGNTALDMLKDWETDKAMGALLGAGSGRGPNPTTIRNDPKVRAGMLDRAGTIKLISDMLKADPNHPMVKRIMPDQAARAKVETFLKSLQAGAGAVSYGSRIRK